MGRLGRYRLIRRLGAGGMGKVFLAEDTTLGREVAIKLLRSHLVADPRGRERFRREAHILASLNHPNVVAIYELGHSSVGDYIVMEYVPGDTLRDLLRDGLSPRRALWIGAHIARALEASHAEDVLHRDVKPENVLVPRGQPKLVDFGLARPEARSQARKDASPGAPKARLPGTAGYIAPELIRGGEASAAGDVFALGVVLYECLAGVHPFVVRDGPADPQELVDNVLHQRRRPSLHASSGLPPDIGKIVEATLRPDPETRPSARRLRRALERRLSTRSSPR